MLSDILIAPSLNSLFITGLLLLCILITFIKNFNRIYNLNYYQKIILLSTITIAIGIHGLIHLGVEMQYNFNPYNWF
jgi:hypothetical protein